MKKKDKLDGIEINFPGTEAKYLLYRNGTIICENTGMQRKPWYNGDGYAYISVYDNENCKNHTVSIHRLLAIYYIPKTDDDIKYNRNIVHFKDFDNTNLCVDNLEWVNRLELSVKVELHYANIEKTKDYAEFICRLLSKGYDPITICQVLGLKPERFCNVISRIEKRKIYKDISKKYKF